MMAPWLLFGFFAAGVLSVFFSPDYIYKHMGKPGLKSIIKAALFGIPLPLCSCGIIPVTTALKKQGAGNGAAASFLISTPQTGIDSFFATYSMLGWVFTIVRPVTALVTAVFGGLLIERFGSSETAAATAKTSNPTANPDAVRPYGWRSMITVFHYGFVKLPGKLSGALLAGLLLAALIQLLVPADFGARYLQSDWLAIPAMLLFGIPLYVCSTASIPIALSLIVKGISPGAALVFLVTGPATNITTITTMSKVLGGKTLVIYLLSVIAGAVAAGIILNFFDLQLPLAEQMRTEGEMRLTLLQQACAVILLGLAGFHYLRNLFPSRPSPASNHGCPKCHKQ